MDHVQSSSLAHSARRACASQHRMSYRSGSVSLASVMNLYTPSSLSGSFRVGVPCTAAKLQHSTSSPVLGVSNPIPPSQNLGTHRARRNPLPPGTKITKERIVVCRDKLALLAQNIVDGGIGEFNTGLEDLEELVDKLTQPTVWLTQIEQSNKTNVGRQVQVKIQHQKTNNLAKWAKVEGYNVNMVLRYPGQSPAFYADMSAAGFADSGEKTCAAWALADAITGGSKVKYGTLFSPEIVRALIVSKSGDIFESGVSLITAIQGLNSESGVNLMSMGKDGYQLSISAHQTDQFSVATRMIQNMHTLAGYSSAAVLIWAPEGCKVRFHALPVINATVDQITAFDHEADGSLVSLSANDFVQLVIVDPCARQHGMEPQPHMEYQKAMSVVARECERVC